MSTFEFPPEQEFRKWLELQNPHLCFARDWGWFGCPIWCFLSGYGIDPTIYRDGTWSQYREDEYVDGEKLPPWAAEFVWLSDRIHPRAMTFGDCLNLLDNPLYRPEFWMSGKVRHPLRTLED